MLKFYSSSTATVNSKKAIRECIQNALGNRFRAFSQNENLIVIYSSIGHNFKEVLNEAQAMCPKATIVGCTCVGVIGKEGPNENIRALGVMLAETDKKEEFCVAYCDNIRLHNSYEMARQMASDLKEQNPNVNMVHILASGIDIAADKAIEGIESVIGQVPIFGGTSSDNMKGLSTFQFFNDNILERGAVLLGFADPTLQMEMGVHHGNDPFGQPFEVTRSEGNHVYEIEGEPAWSFLMEKLNLPIDSPPGPIIPIAGIGEALPFDLHESYDNQYILRLIVKVDDDLSFYMPVDVPTGKKLWLTQRNEEKIFNGLNRMVDRLVERVSHKEIAAVFHTDCAARGQALLQKKEKDEMIERMQGPFLNKKSIPWLGMYGFGEFAMLSGNNYFHNYTTALYVLTRNNGV